MNRYGDQIVATVQSVMEKELRYNAYKIEGEGERVGGVVGVGVGVGGAGGAGVGGGVGGGGVVGGGVGGGAGAGAGVGAGIGVEGAEPGEKDNQTALPGPTMVQWFWAAFTRDTVRDLVISFFANFGSARASAYLDQNSVGLTASSVAAIVATVASATNHQSAAITPYCPHTTGIAPPGVNYVQSFFNNASDMTLTFSPLQSPLRPPLQTLFFKLVILPPIRHSISLTRQLF